MFFKDAPLTADKEVLIETNKDDFYTMMEEAFENEEFPFDNYRETKTIGMNNETIVEYSYNGYIHKIDCFRTMKKSALFKDVYFTMADLENFLKENVPNGQMERLHVRPNVQKLVRKSGYTLCTSEIKMVFTMLILQKLHYGMTIKRRIYTNETY